MTTQHLRKFVKASTSVLLLALGLLLLSSSVFAQVNASAALSGTIVDKNGAVIKGATVTATNKATGLARSAITDDNGAYKIDVLPAGRYDVKINGSGFADATAENVGLLVGNTNNLDFTLNAAGVTGTVTVTSGETELVSKEKTDISVNITPRDVQDLPLNGRDLANLAYLAPGAKPVDSYDPTKNRLAIFGVNGSSGRMSTSPSMALITRTTRSVDPLCNFRSNRFRSFSSVRNASRQSTDAVKEQQ